MLLSCSELNLLFADDLGDGNARYCEIVSHLPRGGSTVSPAKARFGGGNIIAPVWADLSVLDSSDMIDLLLRHGFVLTSPLEESLFFEKVHNLGHAYSHPDADSDNITRISPDGRPAEAGGGFTRTWLNPHTDRSSALDPPQILTTYIARPSDSGGYPTMCKIGSILSALRNTTGFEQLALHSDSSDLSLPIVFTDSSGNTRIRYRDDEHWHPAGPPHLVRHLRYEVSRRTRRFTLGSGAGYILLNDRIAHGRTSISSGNRLVLRLLITNNQIPGVDLETEANDT